MKKILLITILLISTSTFVNAEQKCSDLPGFKKIGKDSKEYLECLAKGGKFKLKTDSKLTDVVTGKTKLKIPNPLNGLKKLGNALKPDILNK
jgi:hypothetical protein|tara:strand:+ start:250 stop:525 length:276 start_codon:yes stop_codon:yes gene_type:complete